MDEASEFHLPLGVTTVLSLPNTLVFAYVPEALRMSDSMPPGSQSGRKAQGAVSPEAQRQPAIVAAMKKEPQKP